MCRRGSITHQAIFSTPRDRYLHCDGHGALFRVEDGVCVDGPCVGERLAPVPVRVADGMVCLDRDDVALVDEISKVMSDPS